MIVYPTVECTTWTQCKTVGSISYIIIVPYIVAYNNRVIENYARIQAWYESITSKTGRDSANTPRSIIHAVCCILYIIYMCVCVTWFAKKGPLLSKHLWPDFLTNHC